MRLRQCRRNTLALVALLCCVSASFAQTSPPAPAAPAVKTESRAAVSRVPVVFSGGYETDPRDHGRPVTLIAAALGVPPEVFRQAFSAVRPAPAGTRPDPEQVRRNKAALLNVLAPYGVTNDRLDTVSNYYRYVRSRGEWWPVRPASAYAVIEKGAVIRFVITDGGSGYSSPPTISVPGFPAATANIRLSFGTTFDRNGSITAITVIAPESSNAGKGK